MLGVHTASAFNRSPRLVLIVLTLPSRFLYCVSKCSLPSFASSSSSRKLRISSSCCDCDSSDAPASCLLCMPSKLFRSSVTSCRNASLSFTIESSRALVSDGGGGEWESPCCERERDSPSAIAEEMLWCGVPFVWNVGESGGCSSSTSSASGAVDCAAGFCISCC
jgi:hypothetical protein